MPDYAPKHPAKFSQGIWILALGRLLSSIGTGLVLFYLPIYFVNQIGFSSSIVGLAIASASVTGVIGRFLGGSMVDSLQWGRRRTLFLAVFMSGLGAFVLAIANTMMGLFLGNLLMGFGTGLYWPATETMVADLSSPEHRRESFALTRLADNIGLGLGVIGGGLLVSVAQVYRWLFIGDGVSFWIFLVILYFLLPESSLQRAKGRPGRTEWKQALSDRSLRTYMIVNCQITSFIAIFANIIPLYLKNFSDNNLGLSELQISLFFGLNLIFSVMFQMPIAKILKDIPHSRALGISLLFWALGFLGVAIAGSFPALLYVSAIAAMILLAIATVSYTPVASSLVVELAPPNLRGVYLSLNSQCWAVGYFIGPAIGGVAMDWDKPQVDYFWVALALSTSAGLYFLTQLRRLIHASQ